MVFFGRTLMSLGDHFKQHCIFFWWNRSNHYDFLTIRSVIFFWEFPNSVRFTWCIIVFFRCIMSRRSWSISLFSGKNLANWFREEQPTKWFWLSFSPVWLAASQIVLGSSLQGKMWLEYGGNGWKNDGWKFASSIFPENFWYAVAFEGRRSEYKYKIRIYHTGWSKTCAPPPPGPRWKMLRENWV